MAKRDLTNGSILGTIVSFSLPYLLAYFLQLLYGLADMYIIGQFDGVENTTAVAIGSQVMHLVTVVIVSLAMGSTVMIAKAVGAHDDRRIAGNIGNTASLFLLVGVVLAGLLLLVVKPIVSVMSTPIEAVEGTVNYLIICFIGIPFITAYNVIAAVYRGLGDSRTPMYFVAIACVLNIALDYLFIGGFHLGPSGAALGTTIAQACSVLFSFVWMRVKGLGAKVAFADFKLRRDILGGILKTGSPVAVQDGFVQVAFLIITIIVNRRGLNDAAAVGIVEKIICMLFLVPSAMLSTVSTVSAQNFGAGLAERARATLRVALAITVGYGAVVFIAMQFLAPQTVGLFTHSDDVVRLGAQYLRSYSIDAMLAGAHFCFSGYFIACGYSIVSFIHNFCSIVMARIPLSYYFSIQYPDTLFPMGCAAPTGSALSVVICVGFYIWLCRHQQSATR